LLFVGTQSNLLAYDVDRNADSFFVDVQGGVSSLMLGDVMQIDKPVVVVGGNCSILGFDEKGAEVFWTVTGDNISSLALCDVDGHGTPALLNTMPLFFLMTFFYHKRDRMTLKSVSL
jgi:Bardet-Biedl syndrome 2 protein